MDLILVSRKQAETRTYTLRLPDVLFLVMATLLAVAALSASVTRTMLAGRADAGAAAPALAPAPVVTPPQPQAVAHSDLREMATRVSEMQSRLVRLDLLSDRLTRMAGFRADELLGAGETAHPRFDALPPPMMTLAGLMRQVDVLFREIDDRRGALGALESLFALDDVRRKLLPTALPLAAAPHSSDFGWRKDPITGERAYHEGIDFIAQRNTPILAAAGGMVVYSDFHPQYGNMIEVDHGNGLVTRYAHAAKRYARVGDVVTRGTRIAAVGSSGRSTGNHLHFEVRRNGAPLDPARFLRLRN